MRRLIIAVFVICTYWAPVRAGQLTDIPSPHPRLALLLPAPKMCTPNAVIKVIHTVCTSPAPCNVSQTCPWPQTCECVCEEGAEGPEGTCTACHE
jgi:hypothetical protein